MTRPEVETHWEPFLASDMVGRDRVAVRLSENWGAVPQTDEQHKNLYEAQKEWTQHVFGDLTEEEAAEVRRDPRRLAIRLVCSRPRRSRNL